MPIFRNRPAGAAPGFIAGSVLGWYHHLFAFCRPALPAHCTWLPERPAGNVYQSQNDFHARLLKIRNKFSCKKLYRNIKPGNALRMVILISQAGDLAVSRMVNPVFPFLSPVRGARSSVSSPNRSWGGHRQIQQPGDTCKGRSPI